MTDSDGSSDEGLHGAPFGRDTSGSKCGTRQKTEADGGSGKPQPDQAAACQPTASGAQGRPALQGYVKKGGRPVTWVGGGGMDPKRLAHLGVPQLRAVFLEVFGEHTASNNASWLRRKLSESPDATYGQGRCPTVRARDSGAAIWAHGAPGSPAKGQGASASEPLPNIGAISHATPRSPTKRASSRATDGVVPSNDWHAPAQLSTPFAASPSGAGPNTRTGRRPGLKRAASCTAYTDSGPFSAAGGRAREEQGARSQRSIISWQAFDDHYLNHSVEVYWPADKTWWAATITQLDVGARTMHLVYSNLQEESISGSDLEDMVKSGQLSEGRHARNRPARRPSSRRLLSLRLPSEEAGGSEASPSANCSGASCATLTHRNPPSRASTLSARSALSSFSVGFGSEAGAQLGEAEEEPPGYEGNKKVCVRASELQPGMLTQALAVGRAPDAVAAVAQPPLALRQLEVPRAPMAYRSHSRSRASSSGDGSGKAAWQLQQQQVHDEHHVLDGLVLPDLAPLAASFAKHGAVQHEWLCAAQGSIDAGMAVEGAAAGMKLSGGCESPMAAAAARRLAVMDADAAHAAQLLLTGRPEARNTSMDSLFAHATPAAANGSAAGGAAGAAGVPVAMDVDGSDWLGQAVLGPSSDEGTSGTSISDMQPFDGLDDGNACYQEIDQLLSRPLSELAVVCCSPMPGASGPQADSASMDATTSKSLQAAAGLAGIIGGAAAFPDASCSSDGLGGQLRGLFDF